MNQNTKALLRSLTTALVCVAVVFAFLISGIRLLGYQVYGVLTGSMVPTYPVGSLIYVKETSPNDLELRDVITFSSGKTIVTHRIIEIVRDENNPSQLKFRTKGDANNDPDASLVGPADIIGKVEFGIPHLGTIANYIQNPPGLYVTIFAGLALIGLVIFMDTDDNKQANGQQSAPAKAPNLPWLTNLLAKVGITWPKQQENQQPQYPGYPQQGYQQYPQPMGTNQPVAPAQPMAPAQPVAPAQPMAPAQPVQQYPQYQQPMAPAQPGYPQQPVQQYPAQQYPQYQQPYNTGSYAPVQQYPQQYPQYQQQYPQQGYQQYPQYQQQPQPMAPAQPVAPAQQMAPAQPVQQYPQQGYQQYSAPLERPKNPLE